MKSQKTVKILGMMSGTSGDGIDASLVEFSDSGEFKLLWSDSWCYSNNIFERIRNLMNEPSVEEVLYGADYVASLYARAASDFFCRNNIKPDYIAAHGQTIIHRAAGTNWDGIFVNGSMQLLNGSRLSEKLQIPIICNFRERDLAVGGQGAPLVPFGDYIFFKNYVRKALLILNIGGIANLTYLIKSDDNVNVICAYDTGPGNMLMDAYVQKITNGKSKFDNRGEIASHGKSSKVVLDKYLKLAYFSQLPPKSTGRSMFGEKALETILALFPENEKKENVMSTIIDITVESISREIEKLACKYVLPERILVAGGGALNSELMKRLKQRLLNISIAKTDKFGIPVMSRESMAFAALGYAYINKIESNIATGADTKVVLGVRY